MSANSTGLQLSIEAVADIEKGVQVALGQLRTAAAQMQQTISGTETATKKADAASRGWAETLRRYRGEQVQQARQARFLVDEIASIVPVSREAQGALQGLAGVFVEGLAGGLGIGLAIEGTKALLGYMAQVNAAAERVKREQLEKIEESLRRSRDVLKEQTRELEKQRLLKGGMSSEQAETELKRRESVGTRNEAEGRYLAYAADERQLYERRRELQAQLDEVLPKAKGGDSAAQAQANAIIAQVARVDDQIRALAPALEMTREAWDNFAAAATAAGEATKLAGDNAQSTDGAEKRLAEFLGGFKHDLATMDRGPLGRDARGGVDQTGIYTPAIYELPKGFEPDFNSPESKKAFEDYRNELEATRKRTEEIADAGERIGAAMAASFGEGAKAARAMGAIVLDEILKQAQADVVKMAIKWAANTPFPWLAPAAVGAAFAFGRGLIAQIPQRAAGGMVEAGKTYRVNEQGQEEFTPATSGLISPAHAARGGGVTLQFVGGVNDGEGTYRTFRANARAITLALDDENRRLDRR